MACVVICMRRPLSFQNAVMLFIIRAWQAAASVGSLGMMAGKTSLYQSSSRVQWVGVLDPFSRTAYINISRTSSRLHLVTTGSITSMISSSSLPSFFTSPSVSILVTSRVRRAPTKAITTLFTAATSASLIRTWLFRSAYSLLPELRKTAFPTGSGGTNSCRDLGSLESRLSWKDKRCSCSIVCRMNLATRWACGIATASPTSSSQLQAY
mmetsp:Transcript_13994/g.30982  ORF Transcript_13994/g.30982 Transcript_13994/m.30982 type:complete len:210 (+) Transcript_13994:566-1195(+)